ncbi:MAG: universal stress protein [Planctomycetaceae bacterium]|nr:universal stress protein [Planctomycetaceae bacterium]
MAREMKFQKIMFPTDFSGFSQAALPLATSLARDHRATLLVTYVMEPAVPATSMPPAAPTPVALPTNDTPETIKKKLETIVPDDSSVVVEHRLLEGNPGDAIVTLAKEEQADLVVMATHGRTGLTRLLMGSVAEHVVRNAPCSVLTVSPRSLTESSNSN